MRYMTLLEMLDGVRIEARISQNVAHGLDLRDKHQYLINRVQEDLYLNFDWPHLRTTSDVDIDPGTRYKAYPANMNLVGTEEVFALDNSTADERFYPITMGIDPKHYNLKDPDVVADRDTPICRWQNYLPNSGNTNQNMFEVWPVPDVATKVRFRGKRICSELVSDTDTSVIDGPAIVMHVAAELLAAQKAEDAALKLNKAQERIRTLKMSQTADNAQINLSGHGSRQSRGLRYGLDYMGS